MAGSGCSRPRETGEMCCSFEFCAGCRTGRVRGESLLLLPFDRDTRAKATEPSVTYNSGVAVGTVDNV